MGLPDVNLLGRLVYVVRLSRSCWTVYLFQRYYLFVDRGRVHVGDIG